MDVWIERGSHYLSVAWEGIATSLGGRYERLAFAGLADVGSPNSFLNSVTLERMLRDDEAEQLTAQADAFFAQGDGGPWRLLSGWPTPDRGRFGYTLRGHPPIMVRPAGGEAPAAPPSLRIVEARDAGTLMDAERTLVEGYPIAGLEMYPPGSLLPASLLERGFRCWVGYVDEQPATVAIAVLHAEATYVFMVATRPELRGRGYGEAVTWKATLAQPDKPALLQSSRLGRPTYERMGYAVLTEMTNWQRPRVAIDSISVLDAPAGG